jgi:hypothetical protein
MTDMKRCRRCGTEFGPTPKSLRDGSWRVCPACAPPLTHQHPCSECGRPLRVPSRSLCARCLGVRL